MPPEYKNTIGSLSNTQALVKRIDRVLKNHGLTDEPELRDELYYSVLEWRASL